jgi:hypothetical protein
MTKEDQEQLIRVRIIPQLNTLSCILWDDGNTSAQRARRLDSIIDELTNILDGIDDV